MIRVLLVDDDPLILKLYGDGLKRHGFEVSTAGDGLAGIKAVRATLPDVMVLDLMMPKLSGVEVLKFVRGQSDLAKLPVIVLSNAYMNDLTRDAATAGAEKALLKVRCNPSQLAKTITEVFQGLSGDHDDSALVASSPLTPEPEKAAAPAPAAPPKVEQPSSQTQAGLKPTPEVAAREAGFRASAREDFLNNAEVTCAAVRNLFEAFKAANNEDERGFRLNDLYRKVHFITATAGLTECQALAQVASAFEAMLFAGLDATARIGASFTNTMSQTVELLPSLFRPARDFQGAPFSPSVIMAVGPNPGINRLAAAACRQAQMRLENTDDPEVAWECLEKKPFDLLLLDIEIQGAFDLRERIRKSSKYQKLPVIYVTDHEDFASRAPLLLESGDDLIAKPIFPMELVVKAMTRLLGANLGG